MGKVARHPRESYDVSKFFEALYLKCKCKMACWNNHWYLTAIGSGRWNELIGNAYSCTSAVSSDTDWAPGAEQVSDEFSEVRMV